MNKVIIAIAIIVVVLSLSACGGGDKGGNDLPAVTAGDVSACVALRGDDVASWQFSALERASNNVCWRYQQATR